jgi:2-dehydro-3-deoxygalactonokinase
MPDTVRADWIAADWGTTRLRVWAMSAAGRPLARRESDRGMGGLTAEQFEASFLEAVSGWHDPAAPIRAVICGMAGAREGWAEAGYRKVPAGLRDEVAAVAAPVRRAGLAVRILPGLAQDQPADVMRGEETQIAGLLLERPDFDGLAVLPGTHTKWARVADGRVRHFATAMTGELFQLLGRHSILSRSLDAGDADAGDSWDWSEFDRALDGAVADPAGLTRRLFGLRAEALLHGLKPAGLRARLSAELIGAEIAGNLAEAKGLPVVLIGAEELSALYARGLARVGIESELRSAEALTLSGLVAAWKGLPHA